MNKLKRLLKVHDAVRDTIWDFVTKPNPPAEKLLLVPRTDDPTNRFLHFVDDSFVALKNRVQRIERYAFFMMFWVGIALGTLLILAQTTAWLGLAI